MSVVNSRMYIDGELMGYAGWTWMEEKGVMVREISIKNDSRLFDRSHYLGDCWLHQLTWERLEALVLKQEVEK